jgi:hypothetical protein
VVNGAAGVVVTVGGRPITVLGFTVADGRIVEIDAIAEPERARRIAAESSMTSSRIAHRRLLRRSQCTSGEGRDG